MPLDFSKVDFNQFNKDDKNTGSLLPGVMDSAARENPDGYASNLNLANQTGLPVDVVASDPVDVKSKFDFSKANFEGMSQRSPHTEAFLTTFDNAVISQDEVPLLESLEKIFSGLGESIGLAFREGATGSKAAAADSLFSAGSSLLPEKQTSIQLSDDMTREEIFETQRQLISRVFGSTTGVKDDQDVRQLFEPTFKELANDISTLRSRREEITPQDMNLIEQGVRSGIESLALQAPGLALMMLTRSASPSLVWMGTQTGLSSYASARGEGSAPGEAANYALTDAAIEVGTELLPTGTLEKILTGQNTGKLGKGVIRFLLQEVGTEEIATIGQSLNAYRFGLDQQLEQAESTGEIIDIMLERMAVTAVATVVAGGAQGGIVAGTRYALDRMSQQQENQPSQVAVEQSRLDELNKVAESSKLKQRSSDAFHSFVQRLADEGNTHVFVDAAQVALYLQEQAENFEEDGTLLYLSEKVREAASSGADLSIPAEEFMTTIAGTEHYQALRDSMTLKADTPSVFRQEQVKQEMDNQVALLIREAEQNVSEYAEAQAIFESVRDQLIDTGQVNPRAARVLADLVPAWATAFAKRNGLTVAQVYEQAGLKIVGPQTGEAAKVKKAKEQGFLSQTFDKVKEFITGQNVTQEDVTPDTRVSDEGVVSRDLVNTVRESGGITLDQSGKVFSANSGYMVAVRSMNVTDLEQAPALVKATLRNIGKFNRDDLVVGVFDMGDGRFSVDTSVVVQDREEAIRLGAEFDQQSIFDMSTLNVIETGGQGEADNEEKFIDFIRRGSNNPFTNDDGIGADGRLERPPIKDGMITLDHFSFKEGLTELDPAFFGVNKNSTEGTHRQGGRAGEEFWVNRIYFGIATGEPGGYIKESVVGNRRYTVTVPAESLYDLKADPDGFRAKAKELMKDSGIPEYLTTRYYNALSNLEEKLVKDEGYKGYWVKHPGYGLAAVLFDKTPATRYETPRVYSQPPVYQSGAKTQIEFANFLMKQFKKDLGRPLEKPTKRNLELISNQIVSEVLDELGQDSAAATWYKDSIEAALDHVAEIHPEIATDEYKRQTFIMLLAITSNGASIKTNADNAERIYSRYKETGEFDLFAGGAYGTRGKAIGAGLDKFAGLLKELGEEKTFEFLNAKFTVKELKKMGFNISGEKIDTEVYGSNIFGPKIGGAFFQNLRGNWDALTMDQWFMRSWGRWTGTLLNEKGEMVETPANGSQRNWIRQAMKAAQVKLLEQRVEIDIASMQALLWYREKDFYLLNGLSDRQNKIEATDYEQEFKKIADNRIGRRASVVGDRRDAAATRLTARERAELRRTKSGTRFAQSAVNQTQTPAFRAWFGDSKAVELVSGSSSRDAVFAPMRLYHTTRGAEFKAFRPGVPTANSGTFGNYETTRAAIFFTPSVTDSNAYGVEGGKYAAGATTIPVYLKTEHPLDLTDGLSVQDEETLTAAGVSASWLNSAAFGTWEMFDGDSGKEVVNLFQKAGYDSVVFNDQNPETGDSFETWAVFNPTQIKSAVGNSGTFDASDPNILRQSSVQTDTPAFRAWFGDSKVVDENGDPLRIYHGTTRPDVDRYDPSFGEVGNDLGVAFYASNNPREVSANYAGRGPDLTIRIETRVERLFDLLDSDTEAAANLALAYSDLDILSDEELSNYNEHRNEGATPAPEINLKDLGTWDSDTTGLLSRYVYVRSTDENELADRIKVFFGEFEDGWGLIAEDSNGKEFYEEKFDPKKIAAKELDGGQPNILPVFMSLKNPVVVGEGAPNDVPQTVFTYEQEYNEELDEYGEERGTLVDLLMEMQYMEGAGQFLELDYGKFASDLFSTIESISTGENFLITEEGGVNAQDLISVIKSSEGTTYITNEDGEPAIGEFIRTLFDNLGYDGVIDTTVGERFKTMDGIDQGTIHYIAFDSSSVKSAVGNSGTFDASDDNFLSQDGQTGDRGYYDPTQTMIMLTKASDLSTFVHEFAHFMLDQEMKFNGSMLPAINEWYLRNAKSIAIETNKQNAGVIVFENDVAAFIVDGTTGDAAKDDSIFVTMHEQFARGFETYLMEGVAPSVELRNVFATIARWMQQVYRLIRGNLNVNVDQEMREVFDRMMATEEQIKAAKSRAMQSPLFTDAAMAGMTEEQFLEYTNQQEKVDDRAHEELRTKLIRQLRRKMKRWWKQEKQDIVDETIGQLRETRTYRAIETLRNDPDIKLDHAVVKQLVGEKKTDARGIESERIPRRLDGMTVKGGTGLHPDEAAAFLGYNSGDELLSDLIGAKPINEAAGVVAEMEMVRRHGDIFNDGTIEQEADKAVQNEERGKLILAELNALSRSTSTPAIDRQTISDMAKRQIGKLSFRSIHPGKYRKAEILAAQDAAVALAAGDREAAARAKLRQVMNFYLAKEAQAARDEVMDIVDRMGRYNKPTVQTAIRKAENGYWEQLVKILARFEFRKSASLKSVDKTNQDINSWMAARVNEDGDALVLSAEVLNETYHQHWKNVPLNQLRGIADSVANIEHVARYSNKMKLANEEIDFKKLVLRWTEHMDAANETTFTAQRTTVSEGRNWGRWAMAQLTKIPWMATWLDGGDRVGMSYQLLVQPFTDALQGKQRLMKDILTPVINAMGSRSNEDIQRHNRKVFIPELKDENNDGNLMGHQILAVALNTGNEGNLRKMLLGEGWASPDNEAEITIDNPKLQAVLSRMTKEDWDLVQLIWDQMDKLYPMLADVHRRTTGLTPPKVVATPVKTRFGTYNGGYYPVKYDPNRSQNAQMNEERLQANVDSMFSTSGSIHASVTTGTTNERTGFYDPIRLSLDVVPNHFEEVIHFITHHDAVRQVNKLIRNTTVARVIKEKLGPDEYAQLRPWLNDIAKDGRESANKTAIDSVFQRLRFGITLGVMGFKASTGIIQISGLSNSMAEVGAKNTMNAIRHILGSPEDIASAWEFAKANSKVLEHRTQTMDREMRAALEVLEGKRGFWKAVQEASMKHIAYIQTYMVDLPSWYAAYMKEMKLSGDQQKAFQYADFVIEQVQGSGATKDMALLLRNQNQSQRLFTMFMTFFSSAWNTQRDAVRGFRSGKYSTTTIAAKAMFFITLPVLFEMVMKGSLYDEDEEEFDLSQLLTNLALFPIQGLPLIRDVASGLIGDFGYNMSPVASVLERGIESIPRLMEGAFTDEEITKGSAEATSKLVGAFLGVPGVNQVWATGEHLYQVLAEGEALGLRELMFGPPNK